MKTLTKIKLRRYLNRRSNGVVEQLEKLVIKLQAWIAKLDAEQDVANEAMKSEIATIKNGAEIEIERLEYMIAETRANAIDAEAAVSDEYNSIIKEARDEAERARQVEHNMKTLVGSPT